MSASSAAALVAALSRSPGGVETVRKATAIFSCPVEFVLLEENRAITIAAVGPATLQPRPLLHCEQQVLDSNGPCSSGGASAAAVDIGGDHVAALTAHATLDAASCDLLAELSGALATSLRESPPPPLDPNAEIQILAGLRDAVIVLSKDFMITWCNHASLTLLGWAPGEMIGRSATELIHPEDLETALDAATRLGSAHEVYRVRLRLKNALGTWIPVAVTGLDHSQNPAIDGMVLSIRNDEREIESERALDRSRRVSAAILQSLTDAVIATDHLGAITIVNDSARVLFDIDPDTPVASLRVDDIALFDASGALLDPSMHPLVREGSGQQMEVQAKSKRGVRNLIVSGSQVSSDRQPVGLVLTFHDMTQARTDAHELRTRALHDQLTGLANRRNLTQRLSALKQPTSSESIAVCFIGIDTFNSVNDIHGHRIGDAVLGIAADRLRAELRDTDILARPGGDEFVAVLTHRDDANRAEVIAERLRAALSEPYEVDGNRLHLTASVGVAIHALANLDHERILQNAAIALVAAKDRGRDRVELFDEQLAQRAALEESQRNMVRDALDEDRLIMMFQPIVDHHGTTMGVEALARCRTRDGEIIEPAGFLDAIDGTSLMIRLDRRAFELSVAAASLISNRHPDRHIWVACNFSATTLAQSDFADTVLRTIRESNLDPSRICIEVTETAAFDAGPTNLAALVRLDEAGVRIALDDFGTGYSSLSHLRDLPLSTVKIDRSFVTELAQGGTELAIATAVKDLAHSLGFGVVAEGVETADQERAVRELGLDTMQGWFFAKALDLDIMLQSMN